MVREDAIVLRLWDFSETSQTAALFTRGLGMVRCLAKGSKRPRAKFSGGLELATRGEGVLIVKPTADLSQLIEWDLRETHFGLRRGVSAHLAGMCALDVVYQAVRDHDPHERLFDALVSALRAVDEAGKVDDERERSRRCVTAVGGLLWATLRETGYEPALERDVRTGGALAEARTYGFDTRLGGLTGDPAARQDAGTGDSTPVGEVWRVRAETVAAMRALRDGVAESDRGGEGRSAERAVRLLGSWLSVVLDEAPAAQVAFLERLARGE